jgi:anti-sigma factor RsiW
MNANDNCLDMRELISAYRDAELDAEEHRRVDEHLGSCSNCRDELAAVESAVHSLKSLSPVRLSVDFADDLDSIIKRAESEASRGDEAERADGAALTPVPPPPKSIVGGPVVPFRLKSKSIWFATAAAAITVSLLAATYFGSMGGGPVVVAERSGNIVKPNKVVDVDQQRERSQVASSVANQSLVDETETERGDSPVSEVATADGVTGGSVSGLDHKVQINRTPSPRSKDVSVIAQAPKIQSHSVSDGRLARTELFVDDLSDNEALVALTDSYDDGGIFDGISTDEDGLYAIKM